MNKKRDKDKALILIVIITLFIFSLLQFYGEKVDISGQITVIDSFSTVSVSITVTALNITTTAPTTATEDTLYLYDVNATGVGVTFLVNSSGLFSINSNTGLISFTPQNGQQGSYPINISAYTSSGSVDSQSYTLVISTVNDAPELNPIGNLTGETGASNTYTITAIDEENDGLTYSIPSKDGDLSITINSQTGVITIPSGNNEGSYPATIRVSDGNSNVDESITVNIVTTNSPPTILTEANSISNDYTPQIREDQSIIFNLTYNDNDGNNTVNVKWNLKNGTLDYKNVENDDGYTFEGKVGKNAGKYYIYAEVSDGIASVNSTIWNLTVLDVKDTDNDGIYDYTDNCKFISNSGQADSNSNGIGDACEDDFDNDGVDDSEDFIEGDVNTITAVSSSGDNIVLSFKVEGSENLNQSISGNKKIEFTTTTIDSATGETIASPIMEFNHNFADSRKLDLSNATIKEQTKIINGSSIASIIVSGISLALGEKKTIYLDKLDTTKNGICIRDEELSNSNEISNNCNENVENKIGCDGTTQQGYSCALNTTLNKFKITGLSFSGIQQEECTESWTCTSYSACSGGTQTRTCTDNNNCGTENNKPSESQSCSVPGTGSAVAGGGGSESARGSSGRIPSFVIDQDNIKVLLKTGGLLKKQFKIENTGDILLDIIIDPQQLKDIIWLPEYSFKLKAGEERIYDFNIIAQKGVAPGVYVGDILVKAGNIIKLIKTVIEIESERVLFDINLDIPLDYKTINPGDQFTIQSSLLNLGGLSDVEVIIEYYIKNSKGEIILSEIENITVGTQATFTKKFLIPQNNPIGEYVAVATVKYQDSVGTSSETFKIGEKEEIKAFKTGNIIVVTIILIAILVAILIQRKGLKKIEKKLTKKSEEKKKSTLNPEEKAKYLKELKTLEISFKDDYITKEAYERSKKKIQELLNK